MGEVLSETQLIKWVGIFWGEFSKGEFDGWEFSRGKFS